jgi:hypothetical protein
VPRQVRAEIVLDSVRTADLIDRNRDAGFGLRDRIKVSGSLGYLDNLIGGAGTTRPSWASGTGR